MQHPHFRAGFEQLQQPLLMVESTAKNMGGEEEGQGANVKVRSSCCCWEEAPVVCVCNCTLATFDQQLLVFTVT